MSLSGRVVVLTGAAGGIGRGIASALAAEGALLVLVDRDEDGTHAAVSAVKEAGGKAEPAPLDVTEQAAVSDLIDAVVARHGRIDQLWCNAGVFKLGPLLDIAPDEWRQVFAVNVEGALFAIQAALRHMLRQTVDSEYGLRGRIVGTSSRAADIGRPMLPAYGASKAALNHLIKSVAAAHAEQGICATLLYPGNVYEGMWREIDRQWSEIEGLPAGEMGRVRAAESPSGRFQTPEEVGAIARFIGTSRGLRLSGKIVVADASIRDA